MNTSDKHSILIVDDDEGILHSVSLLLRRSLSGCFIDTAVNGFEAVQKFRAARRDLILMDLLMPVMDGRAAFSEIEIICELNEWVMPPVIFCSGHHPPHMLKEVLENSTKHCLLEKPVNKSMLLAAINDRLN